MPRPVDIKINQTGDALSGIRSISGALAGLGTAALAASAAAVGALAAIGISAIKQGLEFNATLEQMQVSFNTFARDLLGPEATLEEINALGDDMLQWVKEISISTPFEAMDLATNLRRLLAMGVPLEDAKDLLIDIGDAVAAMGGSGDMLNSIARAFAQMSAKGKVSTEELMQLAEAGIPAFEMLQEALGVSREDLDKLLRKGLIPASEGIDILSSAIEDRFGGAMADQALTMNGLLSSLSDFKNFLLADITAPLFEELKPLLTELMTIAQSPEFKVLADTIGRELVEAFRLILPLLETLSGPILEALNASMPDLIAAWEGIKAILADPKFQEEIKALGQLIGIWLIIQIKMFRFAVEEVIPRIIHLKETLETAFATFTQLLYIIASPIFFAFKAIEDFVNKTRTTISQLRFIFEYYIGRAIDFVEEVPAKMKNLGGQIMQGLKDGMYNAWQGLINLAQSIANSIKNTIASALQIQSPSKVMEKLGEQTVQGFKVGMEKSSGQMLNQESKFMPTININNPSVRNDGDIKSLAQQVMFEMNKANRTYRGGFATQTV